MTRVFIVLATVMAIVLSALTVASAARWTNTSETIRNYQQLYEAEFAKRVSLESTMYVSLAMKDEQLRRAEQSNAELQQQAKSLGDQLAALRNDLARQTNLAVAAEAGRKKLEEIVSVMTAENTGLQKQNQVLTAENIDLQTRNQRLSSRTMELTGQLAIATDESRNLQEKLYAAEQMNRELQQGGGRRVTRAGEAPAGAVPVTPQVAGPIDGEVTGVDGGYVSINVGESSGVASGMQFMIYRGSTYVGDLQVENVRPKEAGGKLTLVRPGQQVQRGDRVVAGLQAR